VGLGCFRESIALKLWLKTLLGLMSGAYFLLTSLYCLLAFLPYTYTAFIKAPPYPWMPWFAHHQAALYCAAVLAGLMAAAPDLGNWKKRDSRFLVGACLLAAGGVYLSLWPFLPGLQSDNAAFGWSLLALLPVVGLAVWRLADTVAKNEDNGRGVGGQLFGFGIGLRVAFVVSVIYSIGARLRIFSETHALALHAQDAELALWSLISHFALAIAVIAALNLIFLIAAKRGKPRTIRYVLVGTLTAVVSGFVLVRFLDNAMSFGGWGAYVYATWLALALTLWGFSLVLPFLWRRHAEPARATGTQLSLGQATTTWVVIALLIAMSLAVRSMIGGEDWNGFVESTWVLIFWVGMSLCLHRLRPVRANYSATVILATLFGGALIYKAMQATEIFWARPLGSTDDEIALKLDEYGGRDASFQLAHHALGNSRDQACGDICRILRSYTNIRDTHIRGGVRLVEPLSRTQDERPHIFIFVIDSMRPDYLGAYNPQQVNYTPNLDELARDSFVFRNVYTQYAGTMLSEPAIWSGALLLHTHFPQPFDEVNSLRRLAHADGYQLVTSYDSVLRQLFTPSDDVTKLDTDKELWNQYEACSTIEQLESTLDTRQDASRPVLFYAQPMNVHQFARNDVPSPASQHWQSPAGMNPRITYEVHWVDSCLGGFFAYLKRHGMYDDSIIVIASDHGDATGEFGRTSHSTSIWPEIMRVPLIIHVPQKMRERLVYDDSRVSSLIDIAPTLYYLLGHRPIEDNPLYGRPLLAENRAELDRYPQRDLLLASDVRAVYGILALNGRYLYVTYDSPAQSYLFDLTVDPNAQHSILSPGLQKAYDQSIIEHLHQTASFYGYQPGVDSLLTASNR